MLLANFFVSTSVKGGMSWMVFSPSLHDITSSYHSFSLHGSRASPAPLAFSWLCIVAIPM